MYVSTSTHAKTVHESSGSEKWYELFFCELCNLACMFYLDLDIFIMFMSAGKGSQLVSDNTRSHIFVTSTHIVKAHVFAILSYKMI